MRPTALVIALLFAVFGCAGQAQAATPRYGVSPLIVGVTRVIDGDTFEVSTGKKVRVLGIDSCEMGTQGGDNAKQAAQALLSGETVTLTQEPGVDLDKYGRQLRYVTLAGGDFGELMVAQAHTGVYAGHSDGSAAYMGALRARDSNGRDCGGVATESAPATQDTHVYVRGGDDDHHSRVGHKVWRKVCHHWWC
jgi:endonuclease YncB( thermonuclease family)